MNRSSLLHGRVRSIVGLARRRRSGPTPPGGTILACANLFPLVTHHRPTCPYGRGAIAARGRGTELSDGLHPEVQTFGVDLSI